MAADIPTSSPLAPIAGVLATYAVLTGLVAYNRPDPPTAPQDREMAAVLERAAEPARTVSRTAQPAAPPSVSPSATPEARPATRTVVVTVTRTATARDRSPSGRGGGRCARPADNLRRVLEGRPCP